MLNKKYKSFNSIKDGKNWGIENYGEWCMEIINDNKKIECNYHDKKKPDNYYNFKMTILQIFRAYMGNSATSIINSSLRDKNRLTHYDLFYINHLSKSLSYAPKLRENIIVYRFVEKEFISKIKKSSIFNPFHEKGFMSTSLTSIRSKKNVDELVLLRIFLQKGTRGAYIEPLDNRVLEQEFLVQKNSKLWLKSNLKKEYLISYNNEQYEVEVLELYCSSNKWIVF